MSQGDTTAERLSRAAAGAIPYDTDALLTFLVENVRDYAIFALDPTGHILTWNAGAERFKGYTTEEILGRHFSVFYPPAEVAAGKPDHELVVAAEVGRFEEEGWRLRKDGSRFWANVVINALRNERGELVGFAKVTRDLTEQRAAEERALADARRVAEAEAANRTKGEFLAAMSHELRTPLNAIGGYVDLLSLGVRGPVNEQQLADLERIRRSQQHLLGIINDLLNFSRIEAGRVSYEVAAVPLDEALAAVLPMIEPQAIACGLGLEWPPGDPSRVARADRAKVEQIVLNLLSNALKFTPPGGRISVSYLESPAWEGVRVADTGIGIPPEKIDAIFEPFVQVGRSLSSRQEGTGLGLAISRDLARAMGGDLEVRSTLGAGSAFTLCLPREEGRGPR